MIYKKPYKYLNYIDDEKIIKKKKKKKEKKIMNKFLKDLKFYELYYRHEYQCFLIGFILGIILF